MRRRLLALGGAAVSAALAAAVFAAPVASAATFTAGLTSITGTGDDWGNHNGMSAIQVTTGATGGDLTGVSFYVGQVNASPANHAQVAVYADATNLPGAKLAASTSQTLTANSWNTFPLTGVSVAAATKYWLVFNVDGANTRYKIKSGGKAAWKIPTTFGTWPATFGTPSPAAATEQYAINMTWTDVAPPPTTTTPPPTTTTAPPPPPPTGGYPNASNTGVPSGTTLTTVTGDLVVTTAGQVVDAKRVTGNLVVRAAGVKITNSQIDQAVYNESGSFEITDSTVGTEGTATSCPTTSQPMGVGFDHYTATRVKVIGHEDGFRAGGAGVVVRDSYYKACAFGSTPHADGVQDYPSAPGIVLDHNTFDMDHLTNGYTAPFFVHSTGTTSATITNNLAAGGVFTFYLQPASSGWTVTGNRAVAGSSDFGEYETEGHCTGVTWSDNDKVTIDSNYAVTSTTTDNVPCPA